MHPLHLVDAEDLAVLDLWVEWRGGGMGAGHLPFAGGAAEQPACVMQSLKIVEAAYQAIKPKGKGG